MKQIIGYIYITINKINKRVYVGKKESSKYVPTYYGSGVLINRSIKKYGLKNFVNVMIDCANTLEELDAKEKKYIYHFKYNYIYGCYNIAEGGTGGNTFKYKTREEIEEFRKKMTKINKEKCSSIEFRINTSKHMKKRYENVEERQRQSEKIKQAWSNEELRKQQSERVKLHHKQFKRNYYSEKCIFELNGTKIEFNSLKDLRLFLKEKYNYNPDNRTFNKLLKNTKPYIPFHKNNEKLNLLKGMLIYKIQKDVETKADECKLVGLEISTNSKCETTSI